MKKILLSTLFGLTIIACSNNLKKDYIITGASYLPQPKWVKTGKYETSKKDEYKYFISKADNINQRLCEKTANVRANLVVASEISNTVEDAYNNTISSNENKANELTSEKLQQTIKLFLAGIENEENYWERRSYRKELGATENIQKYQCYSLIKMKKTNYDKIVNLSIDKMLSTMNIKDKQKVAKNIKNNIINNENI